MFSTRFTISSYNNSEWFECVEKWAGNHGAGSIPRFTISSSNNTDTAGASAVAGRARSGRVGLIPASRNNSASRDS